jgi:hypothetical protein
MKEGSKYGEEDEGVSVKCIVSHAVRGNSEDDDCGDELGGSQTYEWL